jgi:hypothetical protein
MAEDFAEFTVEIDADDSALKATLARDEKLMRDSMGKMQASADKLTISTAGVGRTSFDAQRGVSALSNSAAVLGGVMGGTVARGVAMIEMTRNLGAAAKGSALAFLGPIGIVAGVALFRKEIAGAINKGLEFVGLLEDVTTAAKNAEQALTRTEGRVTVAERIGALQSALTLEQGGSRREFLEREVFRGGRDIPLEDRTRIVDLTLAIEAAKAENAAALEARREEARLAEQANRAKLQVTADLRRERDRLNALAESELRTTEATTQALAQQLAIVSGLAKPSSFLRDPTQRRLAELIEQQQALQGEGGGGFTIGLRQLSTNAIQQLAGSDATFGPQREGATVARNSEKQVQLQTKIKEILQEINRGGGLN